LSHPLALIAFLDPSVALRSARSGRNRTLCTRSFALDGPCSLARNRSSSLAAIEAIAPAGILAAARIGDAVPIAIAELAAAVLAAAVSVRAAHYG
jgi:hypothetical protein